MTNWKQKYRKDKSELKSLRTVKTKSWLVILCKDTGEMSSPVQSRQDGNPLH